MILIRLILPPATGYFTLLQSFTMIWLRRDSMSVNVSYCRSQLVFSSNGVFNHRIFYWLRNEDDPAVISHVSHVRVIGQMRTGRTSWWWLVTAGRPSSSAASPHLKMLVFMKEFISVTVQMYNPPFTIFSHQRGRPYPNTKDAEPRRFGLDRKGSPGLPYTSDLFFL